MTHQAQSRAFVETHFSSSWLVRFYSSFMRRGLPALLLGFPMPFAREVAMLADWLELGDETLLSLTCGPCDFEVALTRSNRSLRIAAVDLSAAMLGLAAERRRRYRLGRRLGLFQADVYQLPFRSGTFDRVLFCGGLHSLPSLEHGLYELHRVCRPGARIAGQTLCYPTDTPWLMPLARWRGPGGRSPSEYREAFGACGFRVDRWRHRRCTLNFGMTRS